MCGIAQIVVDYVGFGEAVDISVRKLVQRAVVAPQVIGRASLREQQAEHLTIDLGFACQRGRGRGCAFRMRFASARSVPNQTASASPMPMISPKPGREASVVAFR